MTLDENKTFRILNYLTHTTSTVDSGLIKIIRRVHDKIDGIRSTTCIVGTNFAPTDKNATE